MNESDVTRMLERVRDGDAEATGSLFSAAYDELKRIAGAQMRRSAPNQTLTPTALVNEVYLKMVGKLPAQLDNRLHFFGIAAHAMRQLLIVEYRFFAGLKHGEGARGWRRDALDRSNS